MNSLKLLHLCRNLSAVNLNREIHSGSALLVRSIRNNAFRNYDPGLRHRKKALEDDPEIASELDFDDAVDDEVDVMNLDKAYDLNEREKEKVKKTTQYRIIKNKFFSERPQPLMLTCNERHCIKYLHKTDPVQWDFRTLSESFPATPDTIKKIVKGKWNISPERAKRLDAKAQANWELLAQGKLDADERVLEHMKKFVNRREVLLEQIKNDKFYLPEIKKEPVWNNGEFSNVLAKYEKAIKKLVNETKGDSNQKMLEDGISKKEPQEEKSSLELAHELIKETVRNKRLEEKDSFLFSGLKNSYSKPTTLENLEYDVLKKANRREELSVFDKAILEKKLGSKPQNIDIDYKYNSENKFDYNTRNIDTDDNYNLDRLTEPKSKTRNRLGYKPQNVDVDYNYNSERLTEPNSETENKFDYNTRNIDTDDNYNLDSLTEPKSESRNRLGYKPRNVDKDYNYNSERLTESDFDYLKKDTEKITLNKYSRRMMIRNMEEKLIKETTNEHEFETTNEHKFETTNEHKFETTNEHEFETTNVKKHEFLHNIYPPPHNKTLVRNESNVGELLESLKGVSPEVKPIEEEKEEKVVRKLKINLSDPDRIDRENIFYDKEVKDIEATAFWNSGHGSQKKAMLEEQKKSDLPDPPNVENYVKLQTSLLSPEPYPERIRIPKSKWKRGLTFKVKDRYYDDDGEFLYRVPGMEK